MFEDCKLMRVFGYFAELTVASALLLNGRSQTANAQDALPPVTTLQNPDSGGNLARFFTAKTPYEFWLSCLIVFLGLAIITALIFAVRRIENARAEDISRPIIVVTVIIGTLILVTVGYSNEQIAPAFGLFGTIVGYMLGRLSQPQPSSGLRSDKVPPQDEARSAAQ
jgi:glycerol uptake facilitator-like aquaporin